MRVKLVMLVKAYDENFVVPLMCKLKDASLNRANGPITESKDNLAGDELNCGLFAQKYSSDEVQSTKKELIYTELAIFSRKPKKLSESSE